MREKNESRVLWVERAQVLGMLMVVLYHSLPHGYDGPEWFEALLGALRYPALAGFFLTSGLFAVKWKRDGWGAYLKRRAARLLTPWLCVSLLMLAPRYAAARMMGVEVHLTAGRVLMSFLDPHGQGIAPHLWFLPTLFLMAALLPALDAVLARPALRRVALAGLLILSALPLALPTVLCLNELKMYLIWYAVGYALSLARGTAAPLAGRRGVAPGVAGLAAFTLTLLMPALPLTAFVQMAGGALALVALAGVSRRDDPLTAAFRGKTYPIYILSMCAQNLAEVVGYSARWPWPATFLAMLALGLAVPVALCAIHARHPLPRWLCLAVGL